MSQQINLASPQLLKTRYAFGLREMAMGLGLILAGTLGWAGYLYYQASVLETRAGQQEALQAQAQQELDKLSAAANRAVSPLLTERIKTTQAQVTQRKALLAAINGTIENTSVGFASHLRALALSNTEGVWLNGFTLSPEYVELKGSVLNAGLLTTYIDRLGKQLPFAGIKFSGMNAVQAQTSDNKVTAAEQPEHLDFTLYSGSRKNTAGQGQSNGQ